MHKTVVAAFAVFLALGSASLAHDFKIGSIEIDHPWVRPTPPSAPAASGFLTLTNSGSEPDRLVEVISSIAASAEIHRSTIEDGVAKMRPLQKGVLVEPGKPINFEAERLHIMFMKPNAQLKDKEKFPATLVFERAGRVDVEFMVQRKDFASTPENHSGHAVSP